MKKKSDGFRKSLKGRNYFILVVLVGLGMALAGTASAKVITINPAGTGDYPTIQEAIDASQNGDMIILEAGTYTGERNREISYRGKNIEVRGIYGSNNTIIDCQKKGRAFIFNKGETYKAVLDGVTIQNGHTGGYGGAILCEEGSSPSISNCVMEGCYTRKSGGAIACIKEQQSLYHQLHHEGEHGGDGGRRNLQHGERTGVI